MLPKVERRRNDYWQRTASGFGVGVPLATMVVWALHQHGIEMEQPVAAALGGVITAIVLCLQATGERICDLCRYAVRVAFIRRRP
jgi:ABC-type enterobactin transport system permease subunit